MLLFTRSSQAMTDLVLFSQTTDLLVISDLLISEYSLYSAFILSPFGFKQYFTNALGFQSPMLCSTEMKLGAESENDKYLRPHDYD